MPLVDDNNPSDHDIELIARRDALVPFEGMHLCSHGVSNKNYRLTTARGEFLLRISPSWRHRDSIEFELSILDALARGGFPAQRLVAAVDGSRVGTLGGRPFILLTYISGHSLTPERLSPALCAEMGEHMGRLQDALDGFRPDVRPGHGDYPLISALVAESLPRFRREGEAGRAAADELIQDWREVGALFRSSSGMATGVVHADLSCDNILVRDGRLITFIDFGDANFGFQVGDLAFLMMECSTTPGHFLDPGLLRPLLRAYARARGLNPVDRSRLYDAIRFQCFKFLCTSLPYREVVLENKYYHRLMSLREPGVRRGLEALIREELG